MSEPSGYEYSLRPAIYVHGGNEYPIAPIMPVHGGLEYQIGPGMSVYGYVSHHYDWACMYFNKQLRVPN